MLRGGVGDAEGDPALMHLEAKTQRPVVQAAAVEHKSTARIQTLVQTLGQRRAVVHPVGTSTLHAT